MKTAVRFVFLIALIIPIFAWAGLGDNISNLQDATSAKSTRHSTLFAGGRVHHIVSDQATLNHYADSSGQVYAITWEGVAQPDLHAVLGNYYNEYADKRASDASAAVGRSTVVQSANATVNLSSRHGRVRGSAYLRNNLPPDVKPEDLQ
jgi:hypothetical protein